MIWDLKINQIILGEIITCKRRIKEFNLLHLKYVDDFTIAEAINMKEQSLLLKDPSQIISMIELGIP